MAFSKLHPRWNFGVVLEHRQFLERRKFVTAALTWKKGSALGLVIERKPVVGEKSVRRAHRILPARNVGVQVVDGLCLLGDNRVDQVAD